MDSSSCPSPLETVRCTNTWRPTRHERGFWKASLMLVTESWLTVDLVPTLQVDTKKESDRKGVRSIAVKEQLCSKDIELTAVIPPANSDVLSYMQAAETTPQCTETIEQLTYSMPDLHHISLLGSSDHNLLLPVHSGSQL